MDDKNMINFFNEVLEKHNYKVDCIDVNYLTFDIDCIDKNTNQHIKVRAINVLDDKMRFYKMSINNYTYLDCCYI